MKLHDNGQIKVGQHGMHTLLDTEGGREQTVKLQGNLRLVWPGKQCQESRQHQRLQYYEKKKGSIRFVSQRRMKNWRYAYLQTRYATVQKYCASLHRHVWQALRHGGLCINLTFKNQSLNCLPPSIHMSTVIINCQDTLSKFWFTVPYPLNPRINHKSCGYRFHV